VKILITGATGFVGSHLIEEALRHGHDVTAIDCLDYAGPLDSLSHLPQDRLKFLFHDFTQPLPEIADVDRVIHNGAQSHVTRSLRDPGKFVQTNVIGTLNVLEWARRARVKKFVYVSTDEVFGPAIDDKPRNEGCALKPTNPYSATKAGAEFLVNSYRRSFGVPAVITRTVNMFGERQHPEKFVPLAIKKLFNNERVDIHASGKIIGSRQWAYVGEQARALVYLAEHGVPGSVYHVTAGVKRTNLEVLERIALIMGLPLVGLQHRYRVTEATERPGHDLHYAIRESPQSTAWKMKENFDQLLTKTVTWYLSHREWLTR